MAERRYNEGGGALWQQALLLAVGAAAGGLAVGALLTIACKWPGWVPLLLALLGGGVGLGWGSIWLVGDHRRLLWAVEGAAGVDLDGDGEVGDPGPAPTSAFEVPPAPRLVYVRGGVPLPERKDRADFAFFVRETWTTGGRGTSWRRWQGAMLPSGKRVSRVVWEEYVGRLIKAGLLRKGPSGAPLELCADHRAALESLREAL